MRKLSKILMNQSLINLRNSINSKEIPENKNLKKVIHFVEKILDFIKQKGKGIKLLIPKQMLQRLLLIALAQVKAGKTY